MTSVEAQGKLVIAMSSRALFDFSECNRIFEQEGLEAYEAYQMANEHIPLKKGPCYSLVEKLLSVNKAYGDTLIEVVLVSRNSANTGLRVFNSIEHYKLPIIRAAFTDGQSTYPYLKSFGSHLFLTAQEVDVRGAIEHGFAAARLIFNEKITESSREQLKIAFDGDAVLFSDVSERINLKKGLEAVRKNEKMHAHIPLPEGPFYHFLSALAKVQQMCIEKDDERCKNIIRTALVTARSAPSHKRVINTLRAWGLRIDESFFLGGLKKGELLSSFGADIFFDDSLKNCLETSKYVTTGHVVYGVQNEKKSKKNKKSE